jgi:hypothetical protein
MKHVMVDLETLSSRNDACIVSLGAVEFDLETGLLGRDFSANVAPDARFHISGDTVMWWLGQSKDAVEALLEEPKWTLGNALYAFSTWYPKGAALWGNGATFDNVILRHAYGVLGQRAPWHYRDDRCFRTMKAMLPTAEWPAEGVAHKAVDDARRQAMYLVAAWKARAA